MVRLVRFIHASIVFYLLQTRVMVALWFPGGSAYLLRKLGSEQADIERSRFGIHAFIGENGSGKTNTMMRLALRALRRGRTVISTVPIYSDKEAGELHPLYVPFTTWNVLLTARNAVIVMDEMTGVANARESSSLPNEIQLILNQLRKRKLLVLWSSPSWEDAQAQIRRVTRAVTVCEGSWSDKRAYKLAAGSASSEFDEAWIPNRLFHARTFRKSTTAEFRVDKDVSPVVDEWYWGPGSLSFASYDTNGETLQLEEANEAGLCIKCKGTRRRSECDCVEYVERKEARKPKKPVVHSHGAPAFA